MEKAASSNVFSRKSVYCLLLSCCLLLCIASAYFAELFAPIYKIPHKGNITELLIYITVILIWITELTFLAVLCRVKLKYNLLWNDIKKRQLPFVKLVAVWALTFGAILLVSGLLGWKVKIVYDLGMKVIMLDAFCNLSLIALRMAESVILCAFIKCVEEAMKDIIPRKLPVPYGGIALFLTYGTARYLYTGGPMHLYGTNELSLLFWFFCILYGIIYKLTEESFPVTSILIWLIFIL